MPERADSSQYHSLPSGPGAIPHGLPPEVEIANSVIVPLVVIRPILLTLFSVNQRLPSGPATMSSGSLLGVGIANSAMPPTVVMRPILFAPGSRNHKFP